MPSYDIYSRAEAMAYWSTLPHADREVTRDWLQKLIDDTEGTGFDLIAEYQGRVVGKGGMYRPPEFGYMLHPDVWGLGLGTEMAVMILRHAFDVYDIPAVTADVDPENTSSLALLSKLGFTETGRQQNTFEIGGVWKHSIYLKLSRTDWVGRMTERFV